MKVILFNLFHAGDIVMARTIIQEICAANPEHEFTLQCRKCYTYLWKDLGVNLEGLKPGQHPFGDGRKLNLWFAYYPDMLTHGLTYRNHVETYNRQAKDLELAQIPYATEQRFVELPRPEIKKVPPRSVLVENGPVLSGQPALDIDKHLARLAGEFPNVRFYCSGKIREPRPNLVDVSEWNLLKLSVLSERCQGMISRLSAVMVCSFTEGNHGRRRIVFGTPLGCPIWDEKGTVYVQDYENLVTHLRVVLNDRHQRT